MAYEFNHYYEIQNVATGKYVNVLGNHEDGTVKNGETVNLFNRTNNPDQRWALENFGGNGNVRIVLQRGEGWYALNYNTRNTNCIVWHLNTADDTDTVITTVEVENRPNTYYLIFFFGSCFQQGQISIQPLCVCATFITVMQIAALLLISWMEQNANFREEAISLQAKSKAQQESIEALSAAYAQQRKLTHDFLAHLSTLDGMLMQQNRDINTIQTYIHSLQSKQNERILLVNTHHAALDALLNQKALVAKNRKIDIQFSVNDLSPIKIDMVDLTVVISNTLDNAIEACEKLPETDRQIYVQALLEEDELFYAVRNKSLPVNMIANQLPTSTKENPSFHGYGLQNVHATLEKYHTLYAMDYENGWFEFATELPNTLIS